MTVQFLLTQIKVTELDNHSFLHTSLSVLFLNSLYQWIQWSQVKLAINSVSVAMKNWSEESSGSGMSTFGLPFNFYELMTSYKSVNRCVVLLYNQVK